MLTRSLGSLHHQFDQVVHEDLEGGVVRDVVAALGVGGGARVLGGVHLALQVTFLSTPLVADVVARLGEPVLQDHLTILHRGLKQFPEGGVLFLQVVALVLPGLDAVAVPDHHLEVSVQQQDHVRLQGLDVQVDRLRVGVLEGVLQQGRLDHHQGVGDVLPQQGLFVVGALVGGESEGLDEVAPPEVVHELGVERELFVEFKRGHVLRTVVAELGHQPDQGTVHPLHHLLVVFGVSLQEGQAGHGSAGSLLVEALRHLLHLAVPHHLLGHGGDTRVALASGVLVGGLELKEGGAVGQAGGGCLFGQVEEQTHGGALVHLAQVPGGGAPLAHLLVRHHRPGLLETGGRSHQAGHLEFLADQHLQFGLAACLLVSVLVFFEEFLVAVSEGLALELFVHDHVASRVLTQRTHLQQAELVQGEGEDVMGHLVLDRPVGHPLVELGRPLEVLCLGGLLVDVVVRTDFLVEGGVDDLARAVGASPAEEGEHAAALDRGRLQKTGGDVEGRASGSKLSLLGPGVPGVCGEVVQDAVELELALLQGHQELTEDHVLVLALLPAEDAQLFLDLLGGVLLGPREGETLGTLLEAEFMDEDELAEGDEADQSLRGEEVERLLDAVLDCVEFLLGDAEVHHEEEDVGVQGRTGVNVLDGGVGLLQFGRQVLFRDEVGVLGGEGHAGETEVAHPLLVLEVHLAVRVQHRHAGTALHRLVLYQGQVLQVLVGRIQARHRHHVLSHLLGSRRQVVPTESHCVLVLLCVEVHIYLSIYIY